MKKSKYNIFRKINEEEQIINSFSLAIVKIDESFFKIYKNLENINYNSLSDNDKKIYDAMRDANFIIGDETDELKDLEFFRLKNIADKKTFGLVIYPTLTCNFDCYYCYEKNKTGVMSKKVQEKILDLIKHHAENKSEIRIEWMGGEPLLKFDIIYDMSQKMIEICKENKVKYVADIVTNGYLFNDDIIAKLNECNIKFVQVTLDGPPEIHNKRRFLKNSKEGTFDKILENAKKLKENNYDISIRVNVNKNIEFDALKKLADILDENNLKENFHIAQEDFDESDKKTCYSEDCFSDEDFAKFNLEFCKKLHDLGIQELGKYYYPKLVLNVCLATNFNIFEIDPKGYLYKCHNHIGIPEKAVGNILDDSTFNETYFNNHVKYMTWSPFKFNKCTECNILPICSGNCPDRGLAKSEPQCKIWKYNIEDLIDAVV